MKRIVVIFLLVLLLGVLSGWSYVYFFNGEIPYVSAYLGSEAKDTAPESDEEAAPKDVVATVKSTPVRKGTITQTRVLYGEVVPGKGSLETVSAPFECKVLRILVRKGIEVAKGDPLIEIGPTEDSRLSLEQAQNKTDMAQQELERVKQRVALKLSTNQELIQATNAFRDAELLTKSLERKGMTKAVTIQAESEGIVNSVGVQDGAIATIGTALLDVANLSKLEVQLGAEPEIVSAMTEGQQVLISNLGKATPEKIACPIRGIARTVNPDTHLVDVFATAPDTSGLMLGEPVRGELSVNSEEGLIIPRSAVLPEEDHYVVFVVKDGRAQRLTVDLDMENDREAKVSGADLHEGDRVVILGNYEVEDGMAVKAEDAP